MIERAQKKLFLDAAVIQQGRLAESSKAISKEEMLGMIRFGADAVFQAEGGAAGLTDADIDALLERGEERTRLDNERLTENATSLASFSLNGEPEKSLCAPARTPALASARTPALARALTAHAPPRPLRQVRVRGSRLLRHPQGGRLGGLAAQARDQAEL